ncbi:thioredoxin domain-containing protein 17-like [Trichoplusia ni]|uniref:Thioredoxin domain-containing protein 17 n=1 Tax=Trichoplusia ni TaxID=7111 RepID=A0A7E5X5B1_TRINI|nr:thioredoxin domain-containing protein 17-like [Trichoplusia ni]
MVTKIDLVGYEEFKRYVETLDSKASKAIFYFSGTKLADGTSWCPDCVEAEPIVKTFMNELKKDLIFGYVDVGDRPSWKSATCPFRTDPRLKLMVIPTIIVWKGVQRLEGTQCTKVDLLQMLVEDEE